MQPVIKLLLIIAVMSSVYTVPLVDALSIEIQTDKKTYYYGERLSFTIQVSKITGESASLVIRDNSGKGSSPIPLQINKLKTTITAPQPFDPLIYKEGTYTLEVEYDGSKDTTEFTLKDTGKIVIPTWIKDMAGWWVSEQIDDKTFAKGIEYLVKNNIIQIPKIESSEQVDNKDAVIPSWVKSNAKWWVQGDIDDSEFAKGIQYLIKNKIIVV